MNKSVINFFLIYFMEWNFYFFSNLLCLRREQEKRQKDKVKFPATRSLLQIRVMLGEWLGPNPK